MTIKSLLRKLSANRRKRAIIRTRNEREVATLRTKLERTTRKITKALDKEDADTHAALAAMNPFPVGTRFQLVAADGLPGGNLYEVTRVVDHETLFARLITAKGKLGATSEQFKRGGVNSWNKQFDLDKARKVQPVPAKGARRAN